MEKYDVKELVEKIYELDVKVYEATGSTMGKVFPAGKDLSVKKMLKHLDEDKRHFIRDETILIGNMISTIKNPSVAEECKKELEELNKMLAQYNPTRQLPDSFVSNISEMKDRFKDGNHRILCIGRQYGSGGHDIGMALAEKLGFSFYDQEIIKMAAGTTGYTQDFISKKEESMTNSLLYDLVSQVYMYAQTNEEAPKDQIFEAEKKVIEELAQKGNCVIVGRCSDYILRNRTDCLKIYFSAPIESRVKRVMKRLNLSEKEAKQRIQREDKRRADNYRYYTGRIWGVAANFDITLNTELGMEYIENCVCEALNR